MKSQSRFSHKSIQCTCCSVSQLIDKTERTRTYLFTGLYSEWPIWTFSAQLAYGISNFVVVLSVCHLCTLCELNCRGINSATIRFVWGFIAKKDAWSWGDSDYVKFILVLYISNLSPNHTLQLAFFRVILGVFPPSTPGPVHFIQHIYQSSWKKQWRQLPSKWGLLFLTSKQPEGVSQAV